MIRLFEYSDPREFSYKAKRLRMMTNWWLNYYKWAMDASYEFMKLPKELDTILYKAYEDVHKHRSTRHDFQKRFITRALGRGRVVDKYKLGEVVFGIFDVSAKVTWKKVQGARSPLDGDTDYWSNRNSILSGTVSEKIYKMQKGICPLCKCKLQWYKSWERHRLNGNKYDNKLSNIQVVHLRCHRKELYRIK